MNTVAKEIPNDSWGFDCSVKLGGDLPAKVATTPLVLKPNDPGVPVSFVWRYVPLPNNSARWDVDATELQALLAAGLTVLLVQHCRAGSWMASAERGAADGRHAAEFAKSVGYPEGACIAMDLESVANAGADVIAHCNEWCAAVRALGYRPVIYVGFSCGLSPDQLFHALTADRYWSDFGPRQVSVRGFCCKQWPQITFVGVPIDPDHAFDDALGGRLVGAAARP